MLSEAASCAAAGVPKPSAAAAATSAKMPTLLRFMKVSRSGFMSVYESGCFTAADTCTDAHRAEPQRDTAKAEGGRSRPHHRSAWSCCQQRNPLPCCQRREGAAVHSPGSRRSELPAARAAARELAYG